jgi:hypothetical protein
MFGNFIKKVFGEENPHTKHQQDVQSAIKAKQAKAKAKAKPKAKPKDTPAPKVVEEKVPLTDKEKATLRHEPWVDVTGFKVNPDNVRNGFFEIDWNDYWIEKLKQEGYGFDGDPEDEIVGRWYRDICINAAAAEGIDVSAQDFGFLKVNRK